jgi:predicted PurR-regulated permease PerM
MPDNRRSDIVFFFAALLLIYVAWRAIDVLLLIYVSALFAVVIAPAINFVRRLRVGSWRPGRGVAALILVLGLMITVGLFLIFALPPIFRDAEALSANWPARVNALTERMHHIPFMEDFNPARLQQYSAEILGGAFGVFTGLAGGVFRAFFFFILMAYFIADGERAFNYCLSMFPPSKRERLRATMLRGEKRMRHWLVGQLMLMFILGSSSTIFFAIIKLKYFYVVGVFAGIANIVPIVGPIVAVTIASIVALFDSPMKLVGVLIFFSVYQQVESAFLTPRIMKATVDLPALTVIIALSLGGAIAGVIGALVAVPTAALSAVLIDEYLVKKDQPARAHG